jgi:hypothetical protein
MTLRVVAFALLCCGVWAAGAGAAPKPSSGPVPRPGGVLLVDQDEHGCRHRHGHRHRQANNHRESEREDDEDEVAEHGRGSHAAPRDAPHGLTPFVTDAVQPSAAAPPHALPGGNRSGPAAPSARWVDPSTAPAK